MTDNETIGFRIIPEEITEENTDTIDNEHIWTVREKYENEIYSNYGNDVPIPCCWGGITTRSTPWIKLKAAWVILGIIISLIIIDYIVLRIKKAKHPVSRAIVESLIFFVVMILAFLWFFGYFTYHT